MGKIEIVLADTDELRETAYRFRYDVYVRQMKRRQLSADHSRARIEEPLDRRGRNYVALLDGRVVGTIRGNTFDDPATTYYRRLYGIERFDRPDLCKVQLTTKLMVLPEYRGSMLPVKLIHRYACDGYQSGIELDFIDCNKHLIEFFERMGYFSYSGWVFHKEFGTIKPMFLATDAISYLESIGSFLAGPARTYISDDAFGGHDLIRRHAELPRNVIARSATQFLKYPNPVRPSHDLDHIREHVGTNG